MSAPRITAAALQEILQPLCTSLRLDLAGAVSLPLDLPHADDFLNWLKLGRHDTLDYMAREPHSRLRPETKLPWLKSVLVFAQRYVDGWAADDHDAHAGCIDNDWTRGVSRYARGLDYHDVMRKDIRLLTASLRRVMHQRGLIAAEEDFRCKDATDAGPYLEREYALLAGLGFIGKNTMLIHTQQGSGLFLGVALTNLEISGLEAAPRPLIGPSLPSGAPASMCGSCSLCLEACPTGALTAPFELDARLCISNWTIEKMGGADVEQRPLQGGLLFGCDICQAVCPWNRKAMRRPVAAAPRPDYGTLATHADLELGDLIDITDQRFGQVFRRTPIWRAHPAGLRRNAMIVAANTGRRDLLPRIRNVLADDPEAQTREVAAWAVAKLEGEA
jgi:epoxyqueuosine reductase